MKQKVVISINTAWNVYNFRAGLIRALVGHGYEVIAIAPNDDYAARLQELGCSFVSLPMDNNGTHPGRDLLLLVRYYRLLRSIRPLAYLGYTVKPNVYGSMAAHALGIPVINNIAGLGATFISDSYVTMVVRALYKFALRRSHQIFFQNADDQACFVQSGLARQAVSALLPGSGINLAAYTPTMPAALDKRRFRFLLVARMLRDKGVEEYAAAARLLRERGANVEFQLLGSIDSSNPNAIPAEKIASWEQEGLVSYLGRTDDVRPFLSGADCVVLPSYREGVPRSLLEAAAMGRPIIASDAVGCREAVDEGRNGYLCEPRSAASLAQKMVQMMDLTPAQRLTMGAAGRRKVELEFDEQLVIQKYLHALSTVSGGVAGHPDLADQLPGRLNT